MLAAEAPRIDGSGELYTYNRIAMPIMMPAPAAMGIMAGIAVGGVKE